MPLDPEISRQVYAAFNGGNTIEFQRLLREHPEFVRHEDGTDRWLWEAAIQGKLPLVQTLVDLGLDVNIPKDLEDPEDPFCTVEGPILHAASEGHLEVVRWLLDRGAKINYVVRGAVRCLPLMRAATNGHLEVVKLLVERGADIHATWNGFNALTQARDYGHTAVCDYLRSVGARDPRESAS